MSQDRCAQLEARIAALESELAQERRNRADDRTGRTRAEAQLRELALRALPAGIGQLKPIAFARSVFKDRRGTPRQGCLAPAALARLEFAPSVQARDSLSGLEDFSHLWLLFVFHENTNTSVLLSELADGAATPTADAAASSASSALPVWCARDAPDQFPNVRFKIQPPRLGGAKVGVFATRTPHRPNPIGLSLTKIVSVHADASPPYVLLSGADLVDGTPIVDIKPFVPHYDAPQLGADVRLPAWIDEQTASFARVRFARACLDELHHIALGMFPDAGALVLAAQQILINDIRSTHQQSKASAPLAAAAALPAEPSADGAAVAETATAAASKRKSLAAKEERRAKWEKLAAASKSSSSPSSSTSSSSSSSPSSSSSSSSSSLALAPADDALDEPLPPGAHTEYILRLDTVQLAYIIVDDEVIVVRATAISEQV